MTASKPNFSMTKFPKALAAAGLAVALAACGGGGSSNEVMDTSEGTPTLEERQTTQRNIINSAINAARTAVGAVDNNSSAAEVSAAEAAITDAKEAIAAGADLDTAGYTVAVSTLEDQLNTAKSTRTAYLDEQEAKRVAMERKGRNDAARPYIEAINAWSPSTTLATLPSGTEDLETEYKDGATSIKLANSKNGTQLTSMPATEPEDWTAKKFTLSDKSEGTVFTSHTGPETKTTRLKYGWDKFFDITFTTPGDNTTRSRSGTDSTDPNVIHLGSGVSIPPGSSENQGNPPVSIATSNTKVRVSDFSAPGLLPATPSSDKATKDHTTAKKSPLRTANGIKGRFLGVEGVFKLSQDGAITVDSDGEVTVEAATQETTVLEFQPNNIPSAHEFTLVRINNIDDADYMHFGYWITTGEKDGKTTKSIDTFALAAGYAGMTTDNLDGLVRADNYSISNQLRGKATYSGAAAGIYVLETGTIGNEDIYNGEFTATANLTAQFGELETGTIAATDQYRIHGTISGFEPTEGSHDLSGWSLSLNKADLGNPTGDPPVRRAANKLPNYGIGGLQRFTGTTAGGGAAGSWHGKFYGGDGEGLDAGADIPAGYTAVGTGVLNENQAKFDDHPLAVVGEFNGHFNNGHVVGAFGAEKE